jgi:hypothetical protein
VVRTANVKAYNVPALEDACAGDAVDYLFVYGNTKCAWETIVTQAAGFRGAIAKRRNVRTSKSIDFSGCHTRTDALTTRVQQVSHHSANGTHVRHFFWCDQFNHNKVFFSA